jgi:hypothetical protein
LKKDVRVLIVGLLLIFLGLLVFAGLAPRTINPDAAPTFANHLFHLAGGTALACVWIGSLTIGASAVAFCRRMSAKKLVYAGSAFLLSAATVSGISHAFVIKTYAFVPVILPWMVAILAGVLLLLTAGVRALASKPGS